MKKLINYLFLLFQVAHGQTPHHFAVPVYTGIGAYSKKFTDVFSFTSNPAALSQSSSLSAGVFAERKFLLKELNYYSMAVAIPSANGGIGIVARYGGFSDYNETQLGLAYAKNLGPIDLGIQFNYSAIRINGYGNIGAVHADAGMLWHMSEKFHTGVHMVNLVAGNYSGNKVEKPAFLYKLGFGYEASDVLFVNTEICKEEDKPVTLVVALQYMLAGKFFFRGGIITSTTSPWLGAGWSWKCTRIDITSTYHPQLGVTPGLLLIFSAKDKKE